MSDSILTVDSLNKTFVRDVVNSMGKSEDEQYKIIDDLNLFIPQNQITALIGGNGAGKTTLFNIMSGFVKPDNGSIRYMGNGNPFEILSLSPHLIARNGLGRFFQNNHIFKELTVLENLFLGDNQHPYEQPFHAIFKGRLIAKNNQVLYEKAKDTLRKLFGDDNPLWEKKYTMAGNLSYGQQRLLELSRLLMGRYKLLLLDEPTSGVNPAVIAQMKDILQRLVSEEGYTIILIEHNMKFVLDVADFCCFMSSGKIAALGTPIDVIGDDRVQKTYMGI